MDNIRGGFARSRLKVARSYAIVEYVQELPAAIVHVPIRLFSGAAYLAQRDTGIAAMLADSGRTPSA